MATLKYVMLSLGMVHRDPPPPLHVDMLYVLVSVRPGLYETRVSRRLGHLVQVNFDSFE